MYWPVWPPSKRRCEPSSRSSILIPWIVAYSGGKDSTLLLHLAWEIAASVPSRERCRPIYVVSNDTLVESPLVIRHLRKSLTVIRDASRNAGLPITITVTEPCIDQTFWVNVIGRGYIPPTRNFRWCTDRMKIAPTNDLIHELVLTHERAILLVGTRKSESRNRGRAMAGRGVTATTMNPHSTIPNCRMFAPLADLRDEDVWKILMQRKPPWGGSHRDLITLYRNAGGGECPLVSHQGGRPLLWNDVAAFRLLDVHRRTERQEHARPHRRRPRGRGHARSLR